MLRLSKVAVPHLMRVVLMFGMVWVLGTLMHGIYLRSVAPPALITYQPAWPDYAAMERKPRPRNPVRDREDQWRRSYWGGQDVVQTRYVYQNPDSGESQEGELFNITVNRLVQHRMPFRRFAKAGTDPEAEYVFVTANSVNHVYESMDSVASVQKYFPDSTVLYYDWGLKPWQVWDIKRWCNVVYRKFNFDDYPVPNRINEHNATRYQSAKVFAILDALQDYQTVIWMDASIRFVNSDLSAVMRKARDNGGFVFFSAEANHSTYAVTHPRTFQYLPSDMVRQKQPGHFESNVLLIMRTKETYDNILWYWYLCAMQKDCIAPTLNVDCNMRGLVSDDDRWNTYLRCNRADQSVLNVLAANHFRFNASRYYAVGNVIVRRKMTKFYKLRMCFGPPESTLVAP